MASRRESARLTNRASTSSYFFTAARVDAPFHPCEHTYFDPACSSCPHHCSKLGSRATGLTDEEVAAARAKYGTNFTPGEAKPGLLKKIFAQLNNTVVYILIGAAVISAIFKDWADLGLIIAVVV